MKTESLTGRELVKLGDVENPSTKFVEDVVEALNDLDTKITEMSLGKVTGYNTKVVEYIVSPVEWTSRVGGFGFLSVSDHNYTEEVIWTAIAVKAFQGSDANLHPLVVSIDDFYSFLSGQPSLPMKTQFFSDENLRDDHQRPYAIILSDFSSSGIFTRDNLEEIPLQKTLGLGPFYKPTDLGQRFFQFAKYEIPRMLEEHKTIEGVVNIMSQNSDEEDVKYLMCSSLLLDPGNWQSLWYESREGVPLYVVAPIVFHSAVDNLNEFLGHGQNDYSYRARNSLGGNKQPGFSIVDGQLKTHDDLALEAVQRLDQPQHISLEGFEDRVGKIINQYLR